MKLSPWMVLCVGLALGGLAFGSCQASRANEAELRLNDALAKHRGSLDAWEDERRSLTRDLSALRADSASLAIRYDAVRRAAPTLRDSIQHLLARLPDSTRARLQPAILELGAETTTCHEFLANCEQRVANANRRATGDSLQLLETAGLLRSTEGLWRDAERRARPSLFRDLWRSRRVTIPLAALSALLLITHR